MLEFYKIDDLSTGFSVYGYQFSIYNSKTQERVLLVHHEFKNPYSLYIDHVKRMAGWLKYSFHNL